MLALIFSTLAFGDVAKENASPLLTIVQGDKTRNGILRTLSHFAAFFHAFTFDYCQYSIFAQV